MYFGETEMDFRVLDIDECESVAEDFGTISLST